MVIIAAEKCVSSKYYLLAAM